MKSWGPARHIRVHLALNLVTDWYWSDVFQLSLGNEPEKDVKFKEQQEAEQREETEFMQKSCQGQGGGDSNISQYHEMWNVIPNRP